MTDGLICLVMAGGRGTRFWPESTSKKPKQYLNLMGAQSLLADTLDRFEGLIASDHRYVITVKEQAALASEAAKNKINKNGLIFEPSGRNTAPCILLALAQLLEEGATEDSPIAVVPSDHVILNAKGFRETVQVATELSIVNQSIVTIGIVPNFPHTGYGYIHTGEKTGAGNMVKAFKEKPELEVAKEYLKSGEYLWNAGMFVGTIKVFLEEFQKWAPDMFCHFNDLRKSCGNDEELKQVYEKLPKDSIDYAIMEKSEKINVVASRFDWNDLGSWDAMEAVIEKEDSNTCLSDAGHFFHNSKGNIVSAPGKFVALVGVEDLVVVSNDKAVLVMPKSQSQDVKKVVKHLNEKNLNDLC